MPFLLTRHMSGKPGQKMFGLLKPLYPQELLVFLCGFPRCKESSEETPAAGAFERHDFQPSLINRIMPTEAHMTCTSVLFSGEFPS